MISGADDLPEAANRRLASTTFGSGLSVAEFAACSSTGMRPVGLVQGFCVMGWNPGLYFPTNAGYLGSNYPWPNQLAVYRCPHRMMVSSEHPYAGFNIEATGLESVWAEGYNSAHRRLLEEATQLGADGVIGVVDATKSLIGPHVREFHLLGTAVVSEGGASDPASGASRRAASVWSTYLAGAKLAKLLEAGLVPVSIAGAFAAVTVIPSCITEIQEHGRYDTYGVVNPAGEIVQLADAVTSVRRLAREHLRASLDGCSLHGADLQVYENTTAGRATFNATLRGTKVRRVNAVPPLPVPVPTVRLA